MRDWLIKKLGGVTKEHHRSVTNRLTIEADHLRDRMYKYEARLADMAESSKADDMGKNALEDAIKPKIGRPKGSKNKPKVT